MQNDVNDRYPLVSILCPCKNRAKTIRRCIDSILAQNYPRVEIIVQDGASTDGTLEILQSYGQRIHLISELDSGPEDGFGRALARIRGEFFGSCLSDEELLPHAVSWAVENLQKYPDVATIYGDHYVTDIGGNITSEVRPQPWNFESYLFSEWTPPFCASFFRTSCFQALDMGEYVGADEFDFWIGLGARFPIRYVPGIVAKYATHPGQSGVRVNQREKRIASRRRAIERLCSDPRTPDHIRSLREKAIAGLSSWRVESYCQLGAWDLAKEHAPEAFEKGPNPDRARKLAERFYRRGMELYQMGASEQALEYFDLLFRCGVVDVGLHYLRTQILQELGRTPEAAGAPYEGLEVQPDHRAQEAIVQIPETRQPRPMQSRKEEPKFSFVMIVLNGMPFIEYSLKSIYEFAHEVIIVEGAVEKCMFTANPDGSSTDGTVEFIKSFPDPQRKIKLIQGRWPEKCEMQNEALKHVTGDYIWLIDSDEVYKREHLDKIKRILIDDSSITQVNFIPDNFWKGLDHIFVSSRFFEPACHYRRLFKYVRGAVFTSHRPPTMTWPNSERTTEQMHLLDGHTTRKMGVVPYHYSYVLDEQVRQKIELYRRYGWGKDWNIDLIEWYNECFLKWTPENRHAIEQQYPVWTGDRDSHTLPFEGTHPKAIIPYILKKSLVRGIAAAPLFVMQHVIGSIREITARSEHEPIFAIETGTIRSYNENHLSTYHISKELGDRGRLISVDISGDSIRKSRNICYGATNIEFVQSDSIQYLGSLRDRAFHFALLDSVNDKDVVFDEFRLIAPMMVENGILMVDDAGITPNGQTFDVSVPAQKGHRVWQFLRDCGIEPSILSTPGGHGTQLKIVFTKDSNRSRVANPRS